MDPHPIERIGQRSAGRVGRFGVVRALVVGALVSVVEGLVLVPVPVPHR
jgi:hypothetical protein